MRTQMDNFVLEFTQATGERQVVTMSFASDIEKTPNEVAELLLLGEVGTNMPEGAVLNVYDAREYVRDARTAISKVEHAHLFGRAYKRRITVALRRIVHFLATHGKMSS